MKGILEYKLLDGFVPNAGKWYSTDSLPKQHKCFFSVTREIQQ
jgi:hypothetical protein